MINFPQLDEQDASQFLVPPFGHDRPSLHSFVQFILGFYKQYGRTFAWRQTSDAYRILLSEVMLQQTQTTRVQPKYTLFLSIWPDFEALAKTSLDELLFHWKGLGYNRRALNLLKSARATEAWNWTIPNDRTIIASLPGVGKATTAALLSFCYNERAIYLETNIRRVLLHCFYPESMGIADKELELLLAKLCDEVDDYKTWYYALMDYGVLLKTLVPNANVRSAHYSKQGKFENSNRQIRGQLIHLLSDTGPKQAEVILQLLSRFEEERVMDCLDQLKAEGFVQETEQVYSIKKG